MSFRSVPCSLTSRANYDDRSTLFKKSIQLNKELQAEAALHTRRDIKELFGYALKVQQLVDALPESESFTSEWKDGLELALHSMVKANEPPPPPVQKLPKPDLNVEDEYEIYY